MSFLSETESLFAAEDQPGRRNWNKCAVVPDVTGSEAVLFSVDDLMPATLSELCRQDTNAIHPSVASCIDNLLKMHKQGHAVEAQLDVQLNVSLLPMYLQELFTTRIHVSADMLLHPEQVQDIGYIIRDIILHRQRHDVLFKLYQYTMPFIKHNRLNFPPMQCTSRVVLRHMMQVIALTCLGLYSPQNKKPTWNIRRQLFRFFTTLMTRGSLRDVYVFCLHNTYLLRLALMEYFIFFSSKYMMTELQLLLECSGLTYNPIRTKTLIEYISDHFRTAALQNELLDWSLIESKAQLAVERCNRTCKAQQHHACEPQQSLG